jgi:hypothetical protein
VDRRPKTRARRRQTWEANVRVNPLAIRQRQLRDLDSLSKAAAGVAHGVAARIEARGRSDNHAAFTG